MTEGITDRPSIWNLFIGKMSDMSHVVNRCLQVRAESEISTSTFVTVWHIQMMQYVKNTLGWKSHIRLSVKSGLFFRPIQSSAKAPLWQGFSYNQITYCSSSLGINILRYKIYHIHWHLGSPTLPVSPACFFFFIFW